MRVSEPLDADAAVGGGSVGLRPVRARARAAEPARSWPQVGVDLLRDLRTRPDAAPRSPVPHDTAAGPPSGGVLAADRPVTPHRTATAPPPALVCSAVGARYRNRRTPTISGIDLVLPARGVLAVVGPSGSGKSTLCAAILGEVEDVSGHVLVDGVAILETPDLAPRLVSFVPQRDALHNELTPRQALGLTADLRLAPSVPKAERERRVSEVLGLLELASHADRRIGQLSGGQRKRVAVAMELLSNPRLLMLDEPTSGLDEGLDLVMMRLLRRVADDGRGVIVVTHSTANLNLADVVLALDIHGKVAFSGPPDGLLEALGVTTYAEAMAALRNGTATADTVGSVQPRTDDGRPVTGAGSRAAEISSAVARRTRRAPAGIAPEIRLLHTSLVLTRRELTRFAANRLTLLRGLFVLPVLSCLLTAWAADRGLAGTPDDPNPWQGVALSVVVTCTTFFAMAMSFGTIVGDRDVIEREHRWGVRPVAVVLAKALALAGPVAFQSLVTMSLYLVLRDGPERPLAVGTPLLVMTGSLMMLGLSSAALGLLISASSRTLERAILLLMGSVALLVVLSGLLIPLAHPEGLGGHTLALVAHTTPSRWGTAALASYVGYVPDPLPGMAPGDTSLQDALWVHDTGHLADAITSMASLGVTYTVAAMFLLTRQCGRRR